MWEQEWLLSAALEKAQVISDRNLAWVRPYIKIASKYLDEDVDNLQIQHDLCPHENSLPIILYDTFALAKEIATELMRITPDDKICEMGIQVQTRRSLSQAKFHTITVGGIALVKVYDTEKRLVLTQLQKKILHRLYIFRVLCDELNRECWDIAREIVGGRRRDVRQKTGPVFDSSYIEIPGKRRQLVTNRELTPDEYANVISMYRGIPGLKFAVRKPQVPTDPLLRRLVVRDSTSVILEIFYTSMSIPTISKAGNIIHPYMSEYLRLVDLWVLTITNQKIDEARIYKKLENITPPENFIGIVNEISTIPSPPWYPKKI